MSLHFMQEARAGASPALTRDGSLRLDQFEVAAAFPVGDSFVVFADFPAPGGYKVFHKVFPEILHCAVFDQALISANSISCVILSYASCATQ